MAIQVILPHSGNHQSAARKTAIRIADSVQEFEVSSATDELAAQAWGCEPCRIAKTLSFMVDVSPILIVAAGDANIDRPKYKAQFGGI